MAEPLRADRLSGVGRYLVHHHHEPSSCGIAFAAWKGFDSPLRRRATLCSCVSGGHALWWLVEAADAGEALAKLPPYLATRAIVSEVSEVAIP